MPAKSVATMPLISMASATKYGKYMSNRYAVISTT
jgi:hypothetical protein